MEPLIDPLLPDAQAGFPNGQCTSDQINHLAEDLERGFEACEKVGVVHVDLTLAYDTVWHRSLNLKIMKLAHTKPASRGLCDGDVI